MSSNRSKSPRIRKRKKRVSFAKVETQEIIIENNIPAVNRERIDSKVQSDTISKVIEEQQERIEINSQSDIVSKVIEEQQSPKTPVLALRWSWYDAQGQGPISRFFRADDPTILVPTCRVIVMVLIGFLITSVVFWLSEDEFFEGTSERKGHSHGSLPFPVHISFKDVGCQIAGVGDVLHDVTGSIPSGKLTGILGQSGSGKTLFSYQLLGRGKRYCSPPAKGTVFLNGRPRSLEAFLDRVGFVPQDDVLYADLTVEESLSFSANWRLPRSISLEERTLIVNQTINTLKLNQVRNSRVGNPSSRGISGGERRRVSIGIELVAKPSVLVAQMAFFSKNILTQKICSEPTSGLDGAGAYQLINMLRGVVDEGKGNVSVVVVVHQPSARIFNLLQHVILMAKGTMVFSGTPNEAIEFLKECGYIYLKDKDPQNRSAAEYILDVLSGEEGDIDQVSALLSANWKQKFIEEKKWEYIEKEMHKFREKEEEFLLQLEKDEQLEPSYHNDVSWARILDTVGLLDHCRDPTHQADVSCVVFLGTPFPVLPKGGLKHQFLLWMWLMFTIGSRRGFATHLVVIHSLATITAFVRSFNWTWSRRPHSNFVLCMVVSLLGMVGAVFEDDIGPVQRAAGSGMILAAHELAQITFTLFSGWFICHWFTLNYFFFLWLRTGVFCCTPFRLEKYYEFAHILHMLYLVASGVGSCICAVTGHDLRSSFILAIGFLMHFHVFGLFSPSQNQAIKDTKILFGKIDASPLVLFYAKWSYVRYAQEALMLWEPDVDSDKVARTFTLRYFSWEESNFYKDLNWMFVLWTVSMIFRFVFFAVSNVNAYNTAFDIPLFIVFLLKVVSLHFTALIGMTIAHELYTVWREAKLEEEKTKRIEEEVSNPTPTALDKFLGNL